MIGRFLLLSGTLFIMMSGVHHRCNHLSLFCGHIFLIHFEKSELSLRSLLVFSKRDVLWRIINQCFISDVQL